MLTRSSSARTAWSAVLGAALLLYASFAATRSEDRPRLPADILMSSSGASSATGTGAFTCNIKCPANGVTCQVCTGVTYIVALGGTPPPKRGWDSGTGFAACGNKLQGTCNAARSCVATLVVGTCNRDIAVLQ